MQAIREFHVAGGSTLTLKIPPEFLGQRLEVIMLPMPVQEEIKPRCSATEALAHFLASEDNGALEDSDIKVFSQGRKTDPGRAIDL